MPASPSYVIAVNVTLSSVVQSSVQVTLRNERSADTLSLTTNSQGDVIFDAANFSSGYVTGDVVTAFCFYTNYESSIQHTIAQGGTTLSLALTAVPASGSLRYFTVQQYYESFGYPLTNNNTELISSTNVVRVGVMIEDQIDTELRSKFDSNSSSYYTQTEYLDTNERNDIYFITKFPVISVSSLQTTQSSENAAQDISTGTWTSLTNGTDYKIDLNTGRIMIITEQYKPITRRNGLYASYTYGRATVPNEIKRLAILMTMEHFAMGNVSKNLVMGRKSSISAQDVDLINREIQRIKAYYMNDISYPTP